MKSFYNGSQEFVNTKTGEKIKANTIVQKATGNFWRFNIKLLLFNLGILSEKTWQVVSYLLDHVSANSNCIPESNAMIYKNINKIKHVSVGRTTIAKTLSFLNKHDLISRRPGVIMFNPNILAKGHTNHVGYLVIKYDVMSGKLMKLKRNHANSKRSVQNKANNKPAKKHQARKSHQSHNASDLMANAPHQQLNMFGKHQDYNAKKSNLYLKEDKQKTAQK